MAWLHGGARSKPHSVVQEEVVVVIAGGGEAGDVHVRPEGGNKPPSTDKGEVNECGHECNNLKFSPKFKLRV